MALVLFAAIFAIEIFALLNRGGGPLLSHLFLTGVVFCVLIAAIKKRNFRLTLNLPHLFYALFFVFFCLSLLVSLTPEYGFSELLLFANAGILFCLFSSCDWQEREIELFARMLIGLTVCEVLAGIFFYTHAAFPRLGGTFLDLRAPETSFANDFADFLVLILPLAFWQALRPHVRATSSLLAGLAAAILMAGFLLSFSRAAWVSVFCVFLFAAAWGLFHRKKIALQISPKAFAVRLFCIAAVCALLTAGIQQARSQQFATTSLVQKLLFQADEGAASVGERIEFWKGAASLIRERPLLGSGILSFKFLYPRYQRFFGIDWDHPHNMFLKIGAENGIFAAVFFGLFASAAILVALRFLWSRPFHPSAFFLFGAAGALAHNLLDYNFIVSNFVLFTVFLGLAISFFPLRERFFVRPTALFALSLLLVLAGLHEAVFNVDFQKGRAALAEGRTDEAVTRLERAQAMFFPRDLSAFLPQAYEEKFKQTKNPAWREKEKMYLETLAKNTIDAAVFFRLGRIERQEGRLVKAGMLFEKAIALDPQNRLDFYEALLDVKKDAREKIPTELSAKLTALLREYETALAENRHFTVITPNPGAASRLAAALGLAEDKKKIDELWFREYVKFVIKYGAPHTGATPNLP